LLLLNNLDKKFLTGFIENFLLPKLAGDGNCLDLQQGLGLDVDAKKDQRQAKQVDSGYHSIVN
jgi:hypothetical protein